MREIKWIVIHCSACRPRESPMPNLYHYYIKRDGTLDSRLPEAAVGDHVPFFNNKSIGICYESFLEVDYHSDSRTAEQVVTMHQLLTDLHARYPEALIVGHRDLLGFRSCSCPCFDVREYYKYLF